jgi:hypothetical protein
VLRNKEGRWAIVLTKTNGHAATAGNGNPLDAPNVQPRFYRTKGARGDFPNTAAGDTNGGIPGLANVPGLFTQ